jgi:hypothetical protein
MAEILKKVIIKNKNLPSLSFDDNSLFYPVRYRVVSEDKNRVSQWSPTYKLVVLPTSAAGLPYDGAVSSKRFSISISGSSPVKIDANWSFKQDSESPTNLEKIFGNTQSFDVWVRWNSVASPNTANWESWEFFSTVNTTSFSTTKRTTSTTNQIEIAVQISTNTKVRDNRLTLFVGKSNV